MARLEVFNVLGENVATLLSRELGAGNRQVHWNAVGQASGVYLLRLTAGEFVATKRIVLNK